MLKIFNETLIPANVTVRGVTDGKHYTLAFHRVMAGPIADEEDKFTPVGNM